MTRSQFAEMVRDYCVAYAHSARYHDSTEDTLYAEERERHAHTVVMAEFDRLTAEVERMRPVFKAAMDYVQTLRNNKRLGVDYVTMHCALMAAVRKALEDTALPEATDRIDRATMGRRGAWGAESPPAWCETLSRRSDWGI